MKNILDYYAENTKTPHTKILTHAYKTVIEKWQDIDKMSFNEVKEQEFNHNAIYAIAEHFVESKLEIEIFYQDAEIEKFIIILNDYKTKLEKIIDIYIKEESYFQDIRNAVKNDRYYSIFNFAKQSLEHLKPFFNENEEETPLVSEFKQKLTWNANHNVLYDLFRQLKNISGKDKTNPLIPNSAEEVALFLKQSFTNFEKTKLSTITTQLKHNKDNPNERPMQGKRIEIDCK